MIQPLLTPKQISDITNHVNMYRSKNQAPAMIWDSTIATFSQQWSYRLLSTNAFQHSGTRLYGENLAMLEGYGNDIVSLIKKSIDLWYNEISLYDFANPDFSPATGHFTCLVWKSSSNFGIGITIDVLTQKAIIVMNTSPPGNVIGQFQDNVLPLVNLPTPTPSQPSPFPVPTPSNPAVPVNKEYILIKLNTLLDDLNRSKPKSKIMNELHDLINMLNNSP